ncbi:MAG: IscS subfamily cysteine desulfurase [Acidobacteria bacterium]|nr:IscS subfamily cysteine desulfurase [Acidobacteriota bacterium]|tara:strand:+ start:700 stop:1860 length:1161 start_codon:yes stop_codon:yes gene_type:complete
MDRSAPIYLDYQATTPLDPEARAAMLPFLEERFGNPHSEHVFGWEAAEPVDNARRAVAELIGASPGEIILTGGATEANNLSLIGAARRTERRHFLVSAIEHKSVLAPAAALAEQGFEVETIPVMSDGVIDLECLARLIRPDTALVSVMAANNEIGTLQPLAEVSGLCADRGVLFHTDAAQLAGKQPIDVAALGIDLLSLSAHKIYGPKGIGALYIASNARSQIAPIFYGGGQQDGMRAGTLAPMLCAGLAAAAEKALTQQAVDEAHAKALKTRLLNRLREGLLDIQVNGSEGHSLSGCLNICIPGIDAHGLLMMLQAELAASVGSACNAGLIEPSYVLAAIGLSADEARASLRLGFGRFTSFDEIDQAAALICEKAVRLSHTYAAE